MNRGPPRGGWAALLAAAVLVGPVGALLAGPRGPVALSLGLSVATGLLALAAARGPRPSIRIALALALAAGVPVHYAATARVFQALGLGLHDAWLAHVDGALLGWLWPNGQLAIAIDRSAWIGPGTIAGRTLVEGLQIAYVSYYLWGYGLLVLLLARYGRGPGREAWNRLRGFLAAWVGAYLLNFVLYLVLPAMGPWWAFPGWFTHDVRGLGLAEPLRALIAQNQVTPDCFPSGHTALSWIVAVVALRVAPRYGRFALAGAVLITVATLVLRYHYATDVIAAVGLVVVGLAWGGWLRRPLAGTA